MPGPCSAPAGKRDDKGRTPRSGKTDVARGRAPRKAAVDEQARIRAALARDAMAKVHGASA